MKIFKKFEFPLTLITIFTLLVLLVMSFLNGYASPFTTFLLSSGLMFVAIDLFSQLKERKNNVKG